MHDKIDMIRHWLAGRFTPKVDEYPADALPIGTYVGLDHMIEGYLGSGGFGYTYLARRDDGRQVALKECFPFEFCRRDGLNVGLKTHDQSESFDAIMDRFEQEAAILASLDHPNIVGGGLLIHAFETVYIEMDRVVGDVLSDRIPQWFGGLSQKKCKIIAEGVLKALREVHNNGYLHKDISPDNIILAKNGEPVLIDFGSAAPMDERPVDDPLLVIKAGYSPQEFYRPGTFSGRASDLYQLAATLRHCITGDRPPESVARMHARARGLADPLPPLNKKQLDKPTNFKGTIDQGMAVFIEERIESAENWLLRLR